MSKNYIHWPRECRAKAREDGNALVAFGFNTSTIQGCGAGLQVVTACDTRTAQIVCCFASNLVHGKMPMEEAYAELVKAVENYDAREAETAAKKLIEILP